jgi:hypothetical protein
MEALAILGLLCALGVLAARWGVDSRDSLTSEEEELAALGVTWGPPARPRMRSAVTLQAWHDLVALQWADDRVADYRREAERERLARQVPR